MRESVMIQDKKGIKVTFEFFKKDLVFTISLLLAAASCLVYSPKMEYINFHVLVSLFNLMLAIKAFEELRVMDKFAISLLNKCQNSKSVSMILILMCFVCSMFVTNDVALLTFVPLTVVISRKTKMPIMETVILQTIAANLGSSLTPMGNPQNLFIYSHYGIKPIAFFTTVLFIAVFGILSLYFFIRRMPKSELNVKLTPIIIEDRKKVIIWGLVLIVIMASILGIISYLIAFILTLIVATILNRKLLLKVDYQLLLTFISFFIFVGNISSTIAVNSIISRSLNDSISVFFSSIFLSQLISNVPASILLANFTTDWRPLLLGVNIGGLGTIIASLASVISYKLFIDENPTEGKRYLIKFSLYNFSLLVFLTLIPYVFLNFFKG